jgi:phosphoenolpyruvate phosphomutase
VVHSKSNSPDEIYEFARLWEEYKGTPLIAIPTIYKQTRVADLAKHGFKMVIFANHAMRASIKAMRETLRILREKEYAEAVDDKVVSLADVYSLVSLDDMKRQEREFMPKEQTITTSVILAAGKPKNHFAELGGKPAAVLEVGGKTILDRQLDALRSLGISNNIVVRGFGKDFINHPQVNFINNENYEKSGLLGSLLAAEEFCKNGFILSYGDVVYNRAILQELLLKRGDFVFVVDHSWRAKSENEKNKQGAELVLTGIYPDIVGHNLLLPSESENHISQAGREVSKDWPVTAEFVGLAKFSQEGVRRLFKVLNELRTRNDFGSLKIDDVLSLMIKRGWKLELTTLDIYGGWMDVDSLADYQKMVQEIK